MDIGPLRLMDNYIIMRVDPTVISVMAALRREITIPIDQVKRYWKTYWTLDWLGVIFVREGKLYLTEKGYNCKVPPLRGNTKEIWIPIE